MSQLLAVLPPYLPSSCPDSVNKTSRRNLFTKNKYTNSAELSSKRLRKNSEGEFHPVPADGCKDANPQSVQGNVLCFIMDSFSVYGPYIQDIGIFVADNIGIVV
jgi:hypothetical protein